MATKDQKNFTDPIKCEHCGNTGQMKIAAEHAHSETQSETIQVDKDEYEDISWDEATTHFLFMCQVCHRPTLRSVWIDERDPEQSGFSKTLYPQPDTMVSVLPQAVRTEYEAAIKLKPINSNAYAVLLGRVLEKVYLDRKASGNSLSEKLGDLAKKGEIPPTLAGMADGLRQLRNIGAHAELGDLAPNEIQILDAIVKAILEYVYRAPRLLRQVALSLDKRKKKTP